MKVIKASVDLEAWSLEVKCKACESTLEVFAKDIWYQWETSECYHAACCLCDTRIYFKSQALPKIVQTDICKHRSIKSTSSSAWD